ncbi:hypothetical protein MTO96_046264 [Rhipicephalus appendiculatus]
MIWSKTGKPCYRRLLIRLASSSCHGCGFAALTRSSRKGGRGCRTIHNDRLLRCHSHNGRELGDQKNGGPHAAPVSTAHLYAPDLMLYAAVACRRKAAGSAAGVVSTHHDDVRATARLIRPLF